jgi:hypothetical protein
VVGGKIQRFSRRIRRYWNSYSDTKASRNLSAAPLELPLIEKLVTLIFGLFLFRFKLERVLIGA